MTITYCEEKDLWWGWLGYLFLILALVREKSTYLFSKNCFFFMNKIHDIISSYRHLQSSLKFANHPHHRSFSSQLFQKLRNYHYSHYLFCENWTNNWEIAATIYHSLLNCSIFPGNGPLYLSNPCDDLAFHFLYSKRREFHLSLFPWWEVKGQRWAFVYRLETMDTGGKGQRLLCLTGRQNRWWLRYTLKYHRKNTVVYSNIIGFVCEPNLYLF